MANLTGALVAVKVDAETVIVMQSKHGGNIFNMGRALLYKYTDAEKAIELVQHGQIFFLKMNGIEAAKFHVDPITINNEDQLLRLSKGMGYANIYIYDKEWLYYVRGTEKFMPLVELLPKN
jgi:hypothetical protein